MSLVNNKHFIKLLAVQLYKQSLRYLTNYDREFRRLKWLLQGKMRVKIEEHS